MSLPSLSGAAQAIMTHYIEGLGLSYVDAIARAERAADESALKHARESGHTVNVYLGSKKTVTA